MFHSSSQKEHWLFKTGDDVEKLRAAANHAYCDKVSSSDNDNSPCFPKAIHLAACESGGREGCADAVGGGGEAVVSVLRQEAARVLQRV